MLENKKPVFDQPKVSVLMCAHNSANFIRSSIDSILQQSYSDFELIIVENGSTDETFDIASSYADERITVYRTSLKQLTYNLNFGLERCRGKYVARMDSDDIADPERLGAQVDFLDRHPNVDFVGCYINTFGMRETTVRYPLSHGWITALAPIRTVMAHPTVMGKKDAFLHNGGYQGMKYSEDLDLWLSAIRAGKILANIPLPLLKYRIHDDQARGKIEGYASAAGTLFKHFIMTKNLFYFFGALAVGMKSFVLGR